MKSKKFKIITVAFASLFISTSLLGGCGNKNSDETPKEPKTTEREIDGKKAKVTEDGNGNAQIELRE